MAEPARIPMTVEDFLAWSAARPDDARHELVAGEPVAMAPERAAHLRLKARVWRAAAAASRIAGTHHLIPR